MPECISPKPSSKVASACVLTEDHAEGLGSSAWHPDRSLSLLPAGNQA
jgi:hypothetical protein